MSKHPNGGPAFPLSKEMSIELRHKGSDSIEHFNGMPLRDYFAAQALAGMFSHPEVMKKGTDWIVTHAYNAADAMLTERAKP